MNRHLAELAGQNLHQQIRIGFMAPVFERVTESLRPLLPHGGSRTFQAVYDEGEWKQLLAEAGENAPLLEKAVTRGGARVALDVSALTIEVKTRKRYKQGPGEPERLRERPWHSARELCRSWQRVGEALGAGK